MNIKGIVAIVTVFSMLFAMQLPAIAAAGQQDAAPRGTVFTVQLTNSIGSDRSQAGDPVYGVLDEPIVQSGRVIFPRDTRVVGEVKSVSQPRGGQTNGKIEFVFNKFILPSGKEVGITANLEGYSEYHESSWRKRALSLAIAVGAGAIISKIFGGSLMRGVLIGGAAGTGYVLYREGEHIVLPEGTTINMVLEETVTVDYATGRESMNQQPRERYMEEPAERDVAEPLSAARETERKPLEASGTISNGPSSTLILNDGANEKGVFSGVSNDGSILLNKEYGQLTIPVNKVGEIVFDAQVDAEASGTGDTIVLKNGKTLDGFFGGFTAGEVVLNSDYGELRIPVRDIARIKFYKE